MDPESKVPTHSKSWSIHTRLEITSKYSILHRIGSGAYADVYKALRLTDSVTVALKEIHDTQSAFREIEGLKTLQHSPNIVVLLEYFVSEHEDSVLVLEYLETDLGAVIQEAKKNRENGGIEVGEIKRWVVQILCGVDACHRNMIVHRDLKPSNLLVSKEGVLKLADFGQARILMEPGFVGVDDDDPQAEEQSPRNQVSLFPPEVIPPAHNAGPSGLANQEQEASSSQGYGRELDEHRAIDSSDETDKEGNNIHDEDASCLATCTASDVEEDPFKSSYSYEAEDGGNDRHGALTSCVGTRWFRAPELLYGSTNYGVEIDLWSLGCIFTELLSLSPLFPGTSDIDQLGKIFSVLGNLSEEVWPGCVELPDFKTISFGKVENPIGLEACLPNRSPDEINLVRKLLCFDPASRATAMELLHDKYLNEEPLPVPVSALRVPSGHSGQDESSGGEWADYREMDSDSDFEDFGPLNVTTTHTGFSIQFP